jgi:choline dehydrogenase
MGAAVGADMKPRAVVVGAGSAGCVVAARLADRYDVVLIEAGRSDASSKAFSAWDAQEAAHPSTWSLPARLTPTRAWEATPGRAVGGSSVVNGGYFEAPHRSDLDAWHALGGAAWENERVLRHVDEVAAQLGVHPSPQTHPIARAFAAAAERSGRGAQLLPLHTTFAAGAPRNVADAVLPSAVGPVEVRADCRALRVVVEDGRAVGVEIADAVGEREVLRADEIVLCAGGFGSARLLLASGIGPADRLLEAGIDPLVDLPGVGAAFSDHPTVWVEWMPTPALTARPLPPEAEDGAFPLALVADLDGGPGEGLEILSCILPPEVSTVVDTEPETFGLIVGLQCPRSRGTVVPASAHPLAPPRISYRYLADEHDRAALRRGVRLAASLLSSESFSGLVVRLVDLDDAVLADDRVLDEWIAARLGSAAHTCGTAPMGPPDDPAAVVDGAGRVRGIAGLTVADTSILPHVPLRGPAAAAMAVGAIIAGQL